MAALRLLVTYCVPVSVGRRPSGFCVVVNQEPDSRWPRRPITALRATVCPSGCSIRSTATPSTWASTTSPCSAWSRPGTSVRAWVSRCLRGSHVCSSHANCRPPVVLVSFFCWQMLSSWPYEPKKRTTLCQSTCSITLSSPVECGSTWRSILKVNASCEGFRRHHKFQSALIKAWLYSCI